MFGSIHTELTELLSKISFHFSNEEVAGAAARVRIVRNAPGASLASIGYMFAIEVTKLLEVIARVAIIYIACFVLLRVSGRREMSELGPMDLLTMLLLSEAVSPALTGDDKTITAGLVAAAVLLGFGVLTSWLSVRSRRLDHLLQGSAKVLIRDGKVNGAMMRQLRITDEDLRAKLHENGLLNVGDVARAYVEADGDITIVKQRDLEQSRERFHAHA